MIGHEGFRASSTQYAVVLNRVKLSSFLKYLAIFWRTEGEKKAVKTLSGHEKTRIVLHITRAETILIFISSNIESSDWRHYKC